MRTRGDRKPTPGVKAYGGLGLVFPVRTTPIVDSNHGSRRRRAGLVWKRKESKTSECDAVADSASPCLRYKTGVLYDMYSLVCTVYVFTLYFTVRCTVPVPVPVQVRSPIHGCLIESMTADVSPCMYYCINVS